MKVYRIKDWDIHYENNRTKEMKEMRWVPIPNSHDGDGYCQMVDGPRGGAVLGAWLACVQTASTCRPRGTLLRKGFQAHTPASLAAKTRLPKADFEEMLKRAVLPSVQWIEVIEISELTGEVDGVPQAPAEIPHPPAVSSIPFHSIPFSSEEGGEGGRVSATHIPPEVEWVIQHGVTIMLPEDQCRQFHDHYTANGWKVGKVAMRNWKSAMQNWLRNFRAGTYNTKGSQNGNGTHTPADARRAAQAAREFPETLTL